MMKYITKELKLNVIIYDIRIEKIIYENENEELVKIAQLFLQILLNCKNKNYYIQIIVSLEDYQCRVLASLINVGISLSRENSLCDPFVEEEVKNLKNTLQESSQKIKDLEQIKLLLEEKDNFNKLKITQLRKENEDLKIEYENKIFYQTSTKSLSNSTIKLIENNLFLTKNEEEVSELKDTQIKIINNHKKEIKELNEEISDLKKIENKIKRSEEEKIEEIKNLKMSNSELGKENEIINKTNLALTKQKLKLEEIISQLSQENQKLIEENNDFKCQLKSCEELNEKLRQNILKLE